MIQFNFSSLIRIICRTKREAKVMETSLLVPCFLFTVLQLAGEPDVGYEISRHL